MNKNYEVKTLRIPQPDKIEKHIVVELTAEEVVTLKMLSGVVGGHPSETARGFMDSLARKLPSEAYLRDYDGGIGSLRKPVRYEGAVYFNGNSRDQKFREAVARVNAL